MLIVDRDITLTERHLNSAIPQMQRMLNICQEKKIKALQQLNNYASEPWFVLNLYHWEIVNILTLSLGFSPSLELGSPEPLYDVDYLHACISIFNRWKIVEKDFFLLTFIFVDTLIKISIFYKLPKKLHQNIDKLLIWYI